MANPPSSDHSAPSFPYGVTLAGRMAFASEAKGDPLACFPSLLIEGCAYNLWLTGQILDAVLIRWSRDSVAGREKASTVGSDIEWAHRRGRMAFQEILPAAAGLGDPAILAALGVTANLQRTLSLLGEFVLDERPARFSPPPFRISRHWCGLIDYPADAPYFPGRIRPPVHAARLRSRRRDIRCLGNALWCSEKDINRHCDEALTVLGREIRGSGCFAPGDLRHLHAHSFSGQFR